GAVGLAVIASVYAAGAVPGQFLPGLTAAFLTSTGMLAAACLISLLVLRRRVARG
ncbi:MAG: transporter, partial [Marmoricola sp.]|nr:transporter [Marmoricola sp.]